LEVEEGQGVEEQVERRLGELRQQYETGKQQLLELERQQIALRETLLRISGAIQVLEELQAAQQAVTLHRPEPVRSVNRP
jgi:flagellar biosynthesis chaperone FliJ